MVSEEKGDGHLEQRGAKSFPLHVEHYYFIVKPLIADHSRSRPFFTVDISLAPLHKN